MTRAKLLTWWRIQKRMALIYLAEWYVACEWPIRILVNYFIFLSIPFWVPPVFMVFTAHRAWTDKKSGEREVLTGKIWYWQMFRMW